MAHGLEKLLDLPYSRPLPSDVPEAVLRDRLPEDAIVLEPATVARGKTKARKATKPAASKPLAPSKESGSETERATLELHCEYWRTIFCLNNWKLYNRYKKHLPADQRRDVDGEDDVWQAWLARVSP
jgi:hypothetical protein